MASQANQIAYNTNSPSALGDLNYWQKGDIVINNGTAVNVQQAWGWVCEVAGFPGTWQILSLQPTVTATTTATSGTLTNGIRFQLLNPATTGTYSLPEASANTAGTQVWYKSLASGSITLTPLATDQYDKGVAAITLAQYGVINLLTDGTTNWFKQT